MFTRRVSRTVLPLRRKAWQRIVYAPRKRYWCVNVKEFPDTRDTLRTSGAMRGTPQETLSLRTWRLSRRSAFTRTVFRVCRTENVTGVSRVRTGTRAGRGVGLLPGLPHSSR